MVLFKFSVFVQLLHNTVNFDRSFYYKNNIKTTLKNKQHKVIDLFF